MLLKYLLSLLKRTQIKTRPDSAKAPVTSIYDHLIRSIDGNEISLEHYKGKKILIVNVASKCSYTPQYKDLQALYEQNNDRLVVLGVPSNDFLQQEPGENKEIKEFCLKNYGVGFPMLEKMHVTGPGKNSLYQWLSDKSLNGWNGQSPSWNFCKYLVSETGELLAFFAPRVEPLSREITSRL